MTYNHAGVTIIVLNMKKSEEDQSYQYLSIIVDSVLMILTSELSGRVRG